jgi:hypothetical protein
MDKKKLKCHIDQVEHAKNLINNIELNRYLNPHNSKSE